MTTVRHSSEEDKIAVELHIPSRGEPMMRMVRQDDAGHPTCLSSRLHCARMLSVPFGAADGPLISSQTPRDWARGVATMPDLRQIVKWPPHLPVSRSSALAEGLTA